MSDWKAKRFWSAAKVVTVPDGFTVHLDARPLRTPSKAPLVVPTHAFAASIAAEWDAQTDLIKPETMPMTRCANSAIDKVTPQKAAVADMLAEYGGSDLLCYRAHSPAELVARQAAAWDPVLDWTAQTLGARLRATQGVMHVAQDAVALAALRSEVHTLDSFALAAFHDLVCISGSLVLALAIVKRRLNGQTAWEMCRIDEDWQIEHWGHDDDASAVSQRRGQAFADAETAYWLIAGQEKSL